MNLQDLSREIGDRPAFPGGMTLRQYYLGNFPDMATVDMMLEQLAREELSHPEPIKTGWEDAPDWARWKAMDADGRWFWWIEEPEINTDGLWTGYGHNELIPNHPPTDKDWKDTLEERPR